jgi:predicted secreted protein
MGGVSRKSFDKFLPVTEILVKKGWSLGFNALAKSWLVKYEWLCRREAVKVVNRIEDFLEQGYSVLGVVGMNDSPTCGVTKTLDFAEMIRRMIIERHEENPMKQIIQDTLVDGPSAFVGSIVSELRKRRIDLRVVGFEPWAVSLKDESERVARQLDLVI